MGKSKSKKSKKCKAHGGGDDLFDSSEADSDCNAMSDLSISYATENVNSQEFVLGKYIDALDEKRGSKREAALSELVGAFESCMLHGVVENKYVTLLRPINNSVKKGSTNEVCLASRAIGLLAITLGAGISSHEIMEESEPQLSGLLQACSDAKKMIPALNCLAVITFLGADDLAETELSLKAMWGVIHPKSGSKTRTVRKPMPHLLAAALSAWTFLLTTVGLWGINTDNWKEPIAFLSTLLDAEDWAVRMAAGEALAVCFELELLDVSSLEDADLNTEGTDDTKNKFFLEMQALKAKIACLASNLSSEVGEKGADKKNLTEQRDLFQRILDFVKDGKCLDESVKIAENCDVLRVFSWCELIQLSFLKCYLGTGFQKHMQENGLLQGIFGIKTDVTNKKIFRSEEDRALKFKKDRRMAQMAFPSPAERPAVPPLPFEGYPNLLCPYQPTEESIPRLEIDVAGGLAELMRARKIMYKRHLDIAPFFVIVEGVIVPVTPLPNPANAAGITEVEDLSSHHILALWNSKDPRYKVDLLIRDQDLYFIAWMVWYLLESGEYRRGKWFRLSGKDTHPVPSFINATDCGMNSSHGGDLPRGDNFMMDIIYQLVKFETHLDSKKSEFQTACYNVMLMLLEPRRLYAMMMAMNGTLLGNLPTEEEKRILWEKIRDWSTFSSHVLTCCQKGLISLRLALPPRYLETYGEEFNNISKLIGDGVKPGELIVILIDREELMLTEKYEKLISECGHLVQDCAFDLTAGQEQHVEGEASSYAVGQAAIIFQ